MIFDVLFLFFFPIDQPSIVYISSKQTVNESDSVTISCKADGFPVPTITWTKSSGDPMPPHIGDTYTIHHASKSDAGIYMCKASNQIGNDATANTEVIVQCKFDCIKLKL